MDRRYDRSLSVRVPPALEAELGCRARGGLTPHQVMRRDLERWYAGLVRGAQELAGLGWDEAAVGALCRAVRGGSVRVVEGLGVDLPPRVLVADPEGLAAACGVYEVDAGRLTRDLGSVSVTAEWALLDLLERTGADPNALLDHLAPR